ncbi:unnamed protein product, partial [Allacma fusca]
KEVIEAFDSYNVQQGVKYGSQKVLEIPFIKSHLRDDEPAF